MLIAGCAMAAYQHYIARIGKPPRPMLDDYAEIIDQHLVWVVKDGGRVVGFVVLVGQGIEMLLDNVAVHPDYQGNGLGKWLLAFAEAEAQRRGFSAITLYTHETMVENIKLYQKLGYVVTERRVEHGYRRVYMKKQLV